ncbi:hypothetical protein P9B03_06815 [Metasolibacillus meyeri]|uniref:Uncharacterized protein n=1 Tax=Metasolibacillus meyeri TaxID=1071052 RepID=A0AAW9NQ99_9BACL|nr:hypothetical protein [Metasolibacillus meyeri]MEC1178190.1 hypothetical protein [Metasolibacillus meyeri]
MNSSESSVHIDDCYCMCKHGSNKVLFYTYSEFELSELNLDTFEIKNKVAPTEVAGSSAIVSCRNKVYFFSPYGAEHTIYLWDMEKNAISTIGKYPQHLRGIHEGLFLAFSESSYTIIELSF